MTVSRLRPLVLAVLAFAAIGCDKGRTNPPDATVRVLNVAPGFPSLQFRREQTSPVDIPFESGSQPAPYDEDTYDFFVSVRNLAVFQGSVDKLTFSKTLKTGTLYTIVLVQSGSGVRELTLETPVLASGATDAQVVAAHAAEALPAMDIFLERPGTDIAGAVPWGSVGYLGTLAPRNVATGDYEITLTAAGDRTNVLLKSTAFTLAAATSTSFVITPEGADSVSPVSITAAGESAFGPLPDRNAQSAIRVINAAADKAPRDVAFNSQFSPPLFAAVPFAAATAYLPIAPGTEIPVNVTPAGNPGVLELDLKLTLLGTRKYTLLVFGAAGVLKDTLTGETARRVFNEANVTVYGAADQFTALDLLIIAPDGDPATAGTAAILAPGTVTSPINVPITDPPVSYSLYLRQTDTTTIVAGPVPLPLVAQGIYSVLVTNGPDSVSATVTLFDDFH